MIEYKDGRITTCTVLEHRINWSNIAHYSDGRIVYVNKSQIFLSSEAEIDGIEAYYDSFMLNFGMKERGEYPGENIVVGCSREIRDLILISDPEEVLGEFVMNDCKHSECQYWSKIPGDTNSKEKYMFHCLLARYKVINLIKLREKFTLHEIGLIYGCTRERIRQVQEKAFNKLLKRGKELRKYLET